MSLRSLCGVLLVVSLALSSVGGVAAAQAGNAPAASTSTPANASAGSSSTSSTIVAEVDSQIRVTDYGYNASAGVFSVRFENVGSSYSEVTVTEAISRGSGSRSFGIEQVRIQAGETVTVEVSARRVEGAAGVMITTQESIDNGEGTYLEEQTGGAWFGSASWPKVQMSALSAGGSIVVAAIIAAWYVVANRFEDVEEVDLDG